MLRLDEFFDKSTMSVHLRENNFPYAKKGKPGDWKFEKIGDRRITGEMIQELFNSIKESDGTMVEIERTGSSVMQKGTIRIVVAKPPFSDGWELTAVRPVRLLDFADYSLSGKLKERIEKKAEGILIAGSPGQGKTTFARALAIFFSGMGKIVKTVEAPRDLVLPDEITQFSMSYASPDEVHDILLLSRPDYTIFDEMRNTSDFLLFSDLRLSGVGMIGVVHATNPVDAIQRFIGRIELGVIPQIIDTVIFIKDGKLSKVFEVKMTVKVPSGMLEADLARPVVIVNDFETGKLEFEIYSYGEETVVIPVEKIAVLGNDNAGQRLAAQALEKRFSEFSRDAKVEVLDEDKCRVYVPEGDVQALTGKGGARIQKLEKELGIKIEIEEVARDYETVKFEVEADQRYMAIKPQEEMIGREVTLFVADDFLLSAKIGKKNSFKVARDSDQGKKLFLAIKSGKKIELRG